MSESNQVVAIPFQQQAMAPPALLERAIASGVSVEVLEKLMGLQERWLVQEAKRSFNVAMANVSNELPPIIKSQTVNFSSDRGRTNYKYEDLSDVTEVLRPVMASHGLSFRWRTQTGDPVVVTCIVSHRDGHIEESSLSAPRDQSGNKNAIQGLGSAITYLQRYTLKAALGVAATHDDDGNSAGQRQAPSRPMETVVSKQNTTASQPPKQPVSKERLRERMFENLKQFTEPDVQAFMAHKGWVHEWPLDEVPVDRPGLDKLIRDMEEFIEAKNGLAPAQTGPEFTEAFWDAVITVPRARMKRADYMENPDTIRGLYEAMKVGDNDARTRLFGLAREWQPQEWTGNDGKLRPPGDADLTCRKNLDLFLEYMDERKEKV